MKQLLKIFSVAAALICSVQCFAQNVTNKGREFWVGYGHDQFMETGTNTQEMVIYLSAEEAANVTVTIDSTGWTRSYSIPANTVIATEYIPKAGTYDARLFSLPVSFGGNGGEGLFRFKGIHIVSDVPIVAYAHIFGSASSGASMLIPIDAWGYSYTTLNSAQSYASNCYSWFYVIAKHDSTLVEITPSVPSVLGKPAGVPFTALLMKGQIYQYTAAIQSGSNGYNASGSQIKSIANASGNCYPIAVFCGSSRTLNTASCGSGGGDNDNQQSFPHTAWGKRYLTAPTSRSSSASQFQTNNYRVLVKDPATVVKRNGTVLTGLTNNYYYFESSTADYIEADQPIMVAQHMTGGNCMGGGSNVGDPEMMYISPIEQAIKRVGFYRNTRESIQVNYLTLIIPTAGVSSLRIDGSATFDYSYPHPNLAGYTVVVKRWSPSAQAQCIVYSDSAFNAITYGLGSVESYGYNAGTYLKNLNARAACRNVYDTATISEFTCTSTPFIMSTLMVYKPTTMLWKLSTLSSVLSPSADVFVSNPVPVDSPFVDGVKYYRYVLPGTYSFNSTGTFEIPIDATHPSIENCYHEEELKFELVVKQKPNSNFNIVHSGCTSDSAHFNGISTTSNNYTVAQWKWEFPGPTYDSAQNVVRLFTPGTYNVKLTVISAEGCVGDTTKPIIVQPRPTAGFTISAPSVCLGSPLTLTDTAANTGLNPVTNWYWNYGNGNTANSATPTQVYSYPNYGTYTIKHVVSSSTTCVSDTVSKIVTVFAKPVTAFTFPNGCLPTNGLVQFTNTTTIADGQTLSYNWNFNDPNASGGNPNTSTQQNPTHNFQPGTYNVQLSATTANGCVKDTIISATFNLKPALAYPPLSAVCQNASAISVATATVTNGVTGTGVYSGPGTSSNGTFTPSVAGYGTHTIWYIFTSTANCKDSISQTILVNAAPQSNFTYPSGCVSTSGFVQFTNTTTIADAQSMSYAWNFGDPNANATNPNTSTAQNPSHNYSTGTYTVVLTVTSSGGCITTVTKNITFNLQPSLAYPALAAVCENISPLSVATATVTNGATGTGIYNGPGTSSNGTFTPSVAGPGTHTIWYIFTATGNCKDSISQTILVHAAPKPNYTYPSGCLNANGFVQFTNTTTIADAQSMNYSWNFNDPNASGSNPNISTAQNPSHNFLPGTYNVLLTVTSSNGCVEDTTRSITFNLKPSLNYSALPSVCQNISSVSVATASVTNGVTGTGVYSGPGTNAAGVFSPGTAGPGIHTIKYVFTSGAGCSDSITQTIKVHPKPASSFTVTANVCQSQAATITDQSTIASGNIVNWWWDLGDATTANYSNGNPFTKTYSNFNTYTVKLVARSDSSCLSDTASKTIAVHAVPAANFTLPTGICMPGGNATFTNTSSVGDNAPLTYQWNFGDGSPVDNNTNPSHIFPAINTYTVQLITTSSFGCTNTISKPFNDFYDKPVAAFVVSPDTLCQGANNNFTDQSMAPNSTVTNWSWTFGDGSTSNTQNPTKKYINAGNYNVSLTVTNTQGCVSTAFAKTVVVYVQPVIDAGPSFVVPQGTVIKFNPKANDSTTVTFLWTPATGLSSATALRPTLTAMQDQTYTLVATGQGSCTATDFMTVKILKPVLIPNAFSPNGDGTNDVWQIQNLSDYPGATVDIFNRYGQQLFHSNGYGTPWDGKYNGSPLPVATYYYVIELHNGFKPLSGSVTIVR